MESSSSRKSSAQGTTLHSHLHQRSLSPSSRFCSSSISASSSSGFATRSTSPTRVTLGRPVSPSHSVRFSTTRNQSIASHHHHKIQSGGRSLSSGAKKACTCSPTTHPGSFRCGLHKNRSQPAAATPYRSSHQLNMWRSAMTNSLVRIGAVEGDLVRRALAALIRPSSHSLRRRHDFQPRSSRLSVMSKAEA
ncbi:serine-rich protein-related [Striga asiatica]|uniref:Serine-rich protein-related n=1 Tax=Striga asiatica TaxID=4170 RepID=A0A5A7QJL1_STRAF|nr:serine-rich protein-related [Striga asiatica]